MPKPYIIGIEVEEVALGLVLRKLNALPGIVALHMDFNKPAANGARRGRPPKAAADKSEGSKRKRRGKFDVTGEEAIINLLRGGKTLSLGQMRDAFAAQGRSPGSLSSVLDKLKRSNTVVRTGSNAYALKRATKEKSKTSAEEKKES